MSLTKKFALAFLLVACLPFGVIIWASYDIVQPAMEAFSRVMFVLFATFAGAAALGLWLARRMAKPILTLAESAKTIAAGRFDARVAVTSRDEVGDIGPRL